MYSKRKHVSWERSTSTNNENETTNKYDVLNGFEGNFILRLRDNRLSKGVGSVVSISEGRLGKQRSEWH